MGTVTTGTARQTGRRCAGCGVAGGAPLALRTVPGSGSPARRWQHPDCHAAATVRTYRQSGNDGQPVTGRRCGSCGNDAGTVRGRYTVTREGHGVDEYGRGSDGRTVATVSGHLCPGCAADAGRLAVVNRAARTHRITATERRSVAAALAATATERADFLTLAERAAWDLLAERETARLDAAAVLRTVAVGPDRADALTAYRAARDASPLAVIRSGAARLCRIGGTADGATVEEEATRAVIGAAVSAVVRQYPRDPRETLASQGILRFDHSGPKRGPNGNYSTHRDAGWLDAGAVARSAVAFAARSHGARFAVSTLDDGQWERVTAATANGGSRSAYVCRGDAPEDPFDTVTRDHVWVESGFAAGPMLCPVPATAARSAGLRTDAVARLTPGQVRTVARLLDVEPGSDAARRLTDQRTDTGRATAAAAAAYFDACDAADRAAGLTGRRAYRTMEDRATV